MSQINWSFLWKDHREWWKYIGWNWRVEINTLLISAHKSSANCSVELQRDCDLSNVILLLGIIGNIRCGIVAWPPRKTAKRNHKNRFHLSDLLCKIFFERKKFPGRCKKGDNWQNIHEIIISTNLSTRSKPISSMQMNIFWVSLVNFNDWEETFTAWQIDYRVEVNCEYVPSRFLVLPKLGPRRSENMVSCVLMIYCQNFFVFYY